MTDSEDKRTQTHTIRNTRPRDSGAKLIFDNPVLCAQFIRDYLNVDILKDVQPEDIEDISERFLSMWQENRDSDCVKKIHLSGTAGPDALFLIAMIEHQSSVDYDMPFRILRYITHILTDYAAEAEKRQPRTDRDQVSCCQSGAVLSLFFAGHYPGRIISSCKVKE